MLVDLIFWRVVIGIFICHFSKNLKDCNTKNSLGTIIEIVLLCCHYFESIYISLLTFLYIFISLTCHGNVELNPGQENFKITNCQFVIGILTVEPLMISQNLHSFFYKQRQK